jgi:hypothetical protein
MKITITGRSKEKKELLDEIASVAEKAFRRGYQQGALAQPSEEHALAFRFSNHMGLYRTSPIPPTENNGKSQKFLTAIQRLQVETNRDTYEQITNLLNLYPEEHLG